MDIYTRVTNLENLVQYLCDLVQSRKEYTDADMDGVRKEMSDLNESVYPEWIADGYDYYTAERVSYNGLLYRCIQSHKSQPDWTPDTAVSLWVAISDPQEEWPEWKQPTGAHDAYAKGAKVTHLFRHWTSDVDNNTWEPGVYGWTEA